MTSPLAQSPSSRARSEAAPTRAEGIRLRATDVESIHLWITPTEWAPKHVTWEGDERDHGVEPWDRRDLGEHKLSRGFAITGRLLDLKGRPLPRQRLAAEDGEGIYGRTAETDADGRFAFAPLLPGRYVVRGENQRSTSWSPETLSQSPSDASIKPVVARVQAGRPPVPIELREVEAVTVVIHHVDSRGNPIRGRPVLLGGEFQVPVEGRGPEEAGQDKRDPTDLPDDVFHPLTEGPMQTLAELLPEIVWGVQGLSGSDGSLVLRVGPRVCVPAWRSTPCSVPCLIE